MSFVYMKPDSTWSARFKSWEEAMRGWQDAFPDAGNTEISEAMQNNEGGWMLRPGFHYFLSKNRFVDPPMLDIWFKGRPFRKEPLK